MAAPLSLSVRFSLRLIFRSSKVIASSRFRKCHLTTFSYQRNNGNAQIIHKRTPQIRLFHPSEPGSSSHSDRTCWKCGSTTNSDEELFFCNCGVVQTVPTDMTYFKVMNCEESFDIDLQSLSNLYKDLQRQLHPDKYSLKSKEEQLLAEQQSSFINKAYTTLLKPLSRGLYLLELHNDPVEEANTAVDPEFLMEIMEVNEDVAETGGDVDALLKIENINSAKIDLCIKDISKAFVEEDVPSAKYHLIKLKYFSNIDDKLKEIYREKMN